MFDTCAIMMPEFQYWYCSQCQSTRKINISSQKVCKTLNTSLFAVQECCLKLAKFPDSGRFEGWINKDYGQTLDANFQCFDAIFWLVLKVLRFNTQPDSRSIEEEFFKCTCFEVFKGIFYPKKSNSYVSTFLSFTGSRKWWSASGPHV